MLVKKCVSGQKTAEGVGGQTLGSAQKLSANKARGLHMSPIMAESGTRIVDLMDAAALCCATGPKCVPGGKQGGDGLHSCKLLQLLESPLQDL